MERHIGYWLKHVDRLVETTLVRVFEEEQLTRRHWQALNVLRRSPQDDAGLTEALRPFWGADAIALDEVTGELARRGWLTKDDGRYRLTPAGEAAHAAIEKKVLDLRETTQAGLSDADYHHTIRVLQRMAENLERSGLA
jgi:DNA-binding MarR family transcriptional regulator